MTLAAALTARMPAVLREEPAFRLLFAGQAASVLGDRVTFIALPFAVLSIGGSAAEVGFVVGATTVPFALFGLAAGVIADRVDRRRLMLASDLARLAIQAVVAALLLAGTAEIWQLAVLGALFGTADAFFQPASIGLMPQVVPEARLQEANALRGLTMSTAMLAGPALAGTLVATIGPGGAIALDAGTFAISAACLARLRPRALPAPAPTDEAAAPGFLAGLRGGWHEVRTRSWVVSVLAAMFVYHVVVLPSVFVHGPVLADRELGGAASWGAIAAAFGVGAIVGDVIALRYRPSRPLRVAVAALVIASTQAAIIGSGASVAVIAALEAVTGVAVALFFTLWETTLQEQIPPAAISRVTSYDFFFSAGLSPLGVVIAGPVADAAGLETTLRAMSIIGVAAALACLAVPAVRSLTRPPPRPAPAGAAPGTAEPPRSP